MSKSATVRTRKPAPQPSPARTAPSPARPHKDLPDYVSCAYTDLLNAISLAADMSVEDGDHAALWLEMVRKLAAVRLDVEAIDDQLRGLSKPEALPVLKVASV